MDAAAFRIFRTLEPGDRHFAGLDIAIDEPFWRLHGRFEQRRPADR